MELQGSFEVRKGMAPSPGPPLKEKQFQAQVVKVARLYGWVALSTWNSKHSPAGEPDLRLIRPPRVVFAELKTEKGRVTPAQREVMGLLSLCPGVEAYLWRPSDWDEIVKVIR